MTTKTYLVRSTAAVDGINYFEKGSCIILMIFIQKRENDSCMNQFLDSDGWCLFANAANRFACCDLTKQGWI